MGSRWARSESALPISRVIVSCPWTATGSSLYIHRLTPGGLQNTEAGSYTCPARFLPFLTYNTSLHISCRFMFMGSKPPLGPGPLSFNGRAPYSLSSWASIQMSVNRPLLGGLHSVVISPTLAPRLIWTYLCQSSILRKIPWTSSYDPCKPPWHLLQMSLVNRHDVTF